MSLLSNDPSKSPEYKIDNFIVLHNQNMSEYWIMTTSSTTRAYHFILRKDIKFF